MDQRSLARGPKHTDQGTDNDKSGDEYSPDERGPEDSFCKGKSEGVESCTLCEVGGAEEDGDPKGRGKDEGYNLVHPVAFGSGAWH